jgi:hypothetical protein
VSPRRSGWGTPAQLAGSFLIVAALLGVAWAGRPFRSEPVPTPPAPASIAAQARAVSAQEQRQEDRLRAEDARLLTLVGGLRPGSAPYVQTVDGVDTLVLTPRGIDYETRDLIRFGAAEQQGGALLIRTNVLVAPDARLVVKAPGGQLRLRSENSGFVSVVAWKAGLELAGSTAKALTVRSWDPGRARPDDDPEDGRAYVRAVSGTMALTDVHATDLGFWAGRTGGIAWTGGSSGPARGQVTHSTFERNHYGVFASEARGLTVTGSRFTANAVDGLTLHRGTVATSVRSSTASGNGRNGISADQGSEDVTLTDVTAAGNADCGVYFSGSPLSDGPSAGGASLRSYGTVAVLGGELRGNGRAGVRIVDADHVRIVGASLEHNRDGVVLVDTAAPTTVTGTTITGGHRFGITSSGGTATLTGNRIVGGDTPIRVRNASTAVTGNTVEDAVNHGISVVGTSVSTSVVGNTIAGRGPSGLDLYRLAPGVTVDTSRNHVDGWVRDRDDWTYWSSFIPNHPMLVLWVVILGMPLTLRLRARRGGRTTGTSPYGDDLRREGPAPTRISPGRPLPPGRPA